MSHFPEANSPAVQKAKFIQECLLFSFPSGPVTIVPEPHGMQLKSVSLAVNLGNAVKPLYLLQQLTLPEHKLNQRHSDRKIHLK